MDREKIPAALRQRSGFFWVICAMAAVCFVFICWLSLLILSSMQATQVSQQDFTAQMREYDLYFPDNLQDFSGRHVDNRGGAYSVRFSVSSPVLDRFLGDMHFEKIMESSVREKLVTEVQERLEDYPTLEINGLEKYSSAAWINLHNPEGNLFAIFWTTEGGTARCLFCFAGADEGP